MTIFTQGASFSTLERKKEYISFCWIEIHVVGINQVNNLSCNKWKYAEKESDSDDSRLYLA